MLFPSGRIAYWAGGRLNERPWKTSAVGFARKYNLPILPVHMSARNSGLFYWLAKWSTELRDMTVFHELLNKKGDLFDFTIGNLIPAMRWTGHREVTRALERHAVFDLVKDADATFTPVSPRLAAPNQSPSNSLYGSIFRPLRAWSRPMSTIRPIFLARYSRHLPQPHGSGSGADARPETILLCRAGRNVRRAGIDRAGAARPSTGDGRGLGRDGRWRRRSEETQADHPGLRLPAARERDARLSSTGLPPIPSRRPASSPAWRCARPPPSIRSRWSRGCG